MPTPPANYRLKRLLLGVLRLHGIPPEGSRRSAIRERLLTFGWPANPDHHSQGGQDRFIDELILDGLRGGTFIEIGANDGINLSNTLFFERERGWLGACIEPNPAAFAKLEANRPGKNLQLAVGGQNGTVSFPVVSDGEDSLYAAVGERSEEGSVDVRLVDLPTLFEECGLDDIDLLSVDTEGNEEGILTSLHKTHLRPRVITVEENCAPQILDRLMADLGYELRGRIWPDRVYALA